MIDAAQKLFFAVQNFFGLSSVGDIADDSDAMLNLPRLVSNRGEIGCMPAAGTILVNRAIFQDQCINCTCSNLMEYARTAWQIIRVNEASKVIMQSFLRRIAKHIQPVRTGIADIALNS